MKISKALSTMALLSLAMVSSFTFGLENERPNIIVVLADDLGYGDVGFNGAKDIITPALDKLAANGVTFSSAYDVHPFCGPSRAGLLTGRYPHKFGSQFNLPALGDSGGLGLPTSERFMSEMLQDAGYFTGVMGKWHLGEQAKQHPNARGFDEFYGFLGGGHNYFPEKYRRLYQQQLKNGGKHTIHHYLRPLEHNGKTVRETEYITDALSREAVNFIDKAEQKQKPFFLYLSYNAPHAPMEAKAEDMAKFPNIKDPKRKVYAGMVYALDRGVKRVVDKLKANGQFDNTLIIFLSDNGGNYKQGATSTPLKGQKGDVHEGGYRTPMLFHWPKKIAAGGRYSAPVSTLDFYPTFAGLAGAKIDKSKTLDGKNIWSALQANKSARKGETLFALRHRTAYSDASARRDNWKVVRYNNEPWRLYDLDNDIAEAHDLSKQHPGLVRDMVREMEIWSWSNVQPSWFHKHEEGTLWREHGMPRFNETFTIK